MPTLQGQNAPSNSKMARMKLDQTLKQNPEILLRTRAGIEAALASGELTQQELDTVIQLAEATIQNPSLYPRARQFVIQQGIVSEQDVSPTYDEGLILAVLTIGRSMQDDVRVTSSVPRPQGGENAPQAQPQQPQQPQLSMREGGQVDPIANPRAIMSGGAYPKPPTRSYKTELHEGEYVIPSHIVRAKGTDFFNTMLEKGDPQQAGVKTSG